MKMYVCARDLQVGDRIKFGGLGLQITQINDVHSMCDEISLFVSPDDLTGVFVMILDIPEWVPIKINRKQPRKE